MSRWLPLRLRVAAVFTVAATIAFVGLGLFVYYRVEATLLEQARVALDAQADGIDDLPVSGRSAAVSAMAGEFFAQILTPTGTVVASSQLLSGLIAPADVVGQAAGADAVVETVVVLVEGEEREREAAIVLLRRDGDQVLAIGTSKEDLDDALWGVRTQLQVGGPIALLLASAAGYLAAGVALRPMERMRRHADAISAHSSGERLPLPAARDEIHRLGRTLNQMLDRLDTGIRRERRFVAEASHELRTPLALLKLELDLALAQPRPAEELVAALRSANEDVDRLTRLSDDLLLLASAGQERSQVDHTDVDVRSMLTAVAARFSTRVEQESRRIVVRCEGHPVVHAHAGRLERAVSNLVDNAVRHGAGEVGLGATWDDEEVSIQVTDEGPGMDEALRSRVFDPFSRSTTGPSQAGRGLGLTIVATIVSELDGSVAVENRTGGEGTVATLTVPRRRTP